jgi:transportin-1
MDMENFIGPWCSVLASLEENDDKKVSFFGLLAAIKENPQAALPHFKYFANAVASWTVPSASLKEEFIGIFHAYSQQLEPPVWQALLDTIDEEDMQILLQHEFL